jgi:hypothetical protein
MATLILAAAGSAVGGAIGGAVLGLPMAIVGRAVGATIGQAIDQQLLGAGSTAVEAGRIERFRLTGASEGAPVQRVWGRMKVAGQVIWATRFRETGSTSRTGGGKGGGRRGARVTTYSYSISLAVALCQGPATRIGRVWADGMELDLGTVTLRFYPGDEVQLPDPKIAAVEGAGNAPAYRGIAYAVFEDLDLAPFGNRVPQFTFEVFRAARPVAPTAPGRPADLIEGVAMIPGTGEYALATTPVHYPSGPGAGVSANVNTLSGLTDFETSLVALGEEVPNCRSVVFVVSWFGTDLRCAECRIEPRVEQTGQDGRGMAWRVSGIARPAATEVSRLDGRPVYGGTPADASVIEALHALRAAGQSVVYYPFILMDVPPGNGRPDPWSGAADQPVHPWRGRITTSVAPGRTGSPDGTAVAEAEVAAFFGAAGAGDFAVEHGRLDPGSGGFPGIFDDLFDPDGDPPETRVTGVVYTGPQEWSFRRFILHQAHLCAAAGGVDAFCIGSEMVALTQIRGAGNRFPAVAELVRLARDVRAILGPDTRIGYAADWSEYFGHHPQDGSGDVFFHLDPLWAEDAIDFVGIDNYMPLSDWRDGTDHADACHGTIYDLDYLTGNVAGGEGYDWYYPTDAARAAQHRSPIADGAHGEPWVFRYKDILNWWRNRHHERIGGVRAAAPTAWVPESKPIWFTEFGCAAIDKGTNQPNKFLDPKSSESMLPHFSDGRRDDLMPMQYLRAVYRHWRAPANNPVSAVYGRPMVDLSRAHVWAWDARPWPAFPLNAALWSDGGNYDRGHWLNGRIASQTLDDVVAEICEAAGMPDHDVSRLYGMVRGYSEAAIAPARATLQPLLLAQGVDAVERGGRLAFVNRDGIADAVLDPGRLAVLPDEAAGVATLRRPEAETAGRVRLSHVDGHGTYDLRTAEAILPDERSIGVAQSDLPLALTGGEAGNIVERWLAESRIARDGARFVLPPSAADVGAGDVVAHDAGGMRTLYRIDRVEEAGARICEAVRVEPAVYEPKEICEDGPVVAPVLPAVPVYPLFLDLPLLTGAETPHAPHLAVAATPWPGSVAVYSAAADAGYDLNTLVEAGAVIGETESALPPAAPGRWDRGAPLRVRVWGGSLASVSQDEVLNGANVAVIGDGSPGNWEVFQFAEAPMAGDGLYEVAMRLRGQAGTDAAMPDAWPAGSRFVLLTPAVVQIGLAETARGLPRHYRIGPARRAYDDPSYLHAAVAFDGIGLRPLSPVHLRLRPAGGGDWSADWVRRTRSDGDNWASPEVPLGEESERYLVRVLAGDAVLREAEVTVPHWLWPAAQRAQDIASGAEQIAVAQISARFGPGLFGKVAIDG